MMSNGADGNSQLLADLYVLQRNSLMETLEEFTERLLALQAADPDAPDNVPLPELEPLPVCPNDCLDAP